MSTPPRTLAECDHEIVEYRKALRLVSRGGRVAVWEQIDRILEARYVIQTTKVPAHRGHLK